VTFGGINALMYLFLFSETFDSIFRIPAAAVKTGDVSSGDA
jgi:hypothetical protein